MAIWDRMSVMSVQHKFPDSTKFTLCATMASRDVPQNSYWSYFYVHFDAVFWRIFNLCCSFFQPRAFHRYPYFQLNQKTLVGLFLCLFSRSLTLLLFDCSIHYMFWNSTGIFSDLFFFFFLSQPMLFVDHCLHDVWIGSFYWLNNCEYHQQAFLVLSFDRKSIFEKYQMENKMARCKLRKHNREIQMTLQGQWEKRGYEKKK